MEDKIRELTLVNQLFLEIRGLKGVEVEVKMTPEQTLYANTIRPFTEELSDQQNERYDELLRCLKIECDKAAPGPQGDPRHWYVTVKVPVESRGDVYRYYGWKNLKRLTDAGFTLVSIKRVLTGPTPNNVTHYDMVVGLGSDLKLVTW